MGINIYVDLDEIYSQMSSWDKKDMVEYLREDGYFTVESSGVNDGVIIQIPRGTNFDQEQHLRLVSKLGGLYYRISDEDMEIIRNIVNKY